MEAIPHIPECVGMRPGEATAHGELYTHSVAGSWVGGGVLGGQAGGVVQAGDGRDGDT